MSRETAVAIREEKIEEVERKAGLWDRARQLIGNVAEWMPPAVKALFTGTSGMEPIVTDGEPTNWIGAVSRLLKMAGVSLDQRLQAFNDSASGKEAPATEAATQQAAVGVDFERVRQPLNQIPIEEVCKRIGFSRNDDGDWRRDIRTVDNLYVHRLVMNGKSFRFENYTMENRAWVQLDESVTGVKGGTGAIELIRNAARLVAPGDTPPEKMTVAEACQTLAKMFPEYLENLGLAAAAKTLFPIRLPDPQSQAVVPDKNNSPPSV